MDTGSVGLLLAGVVLGAGLAGACGWALVERQRRLDLAALIVSGGVPTAPAVPAGVAMRHVPAAPAVSTETAMHISEESIQRGADHLMAVYRESGAALDPGEARELALAMLRGVA